ncbi:MAG: 3'-5' exonuclease [Psychrobacter sp.]|uniref:3'-5' exonuclease n=1 Tax=unclassified Psychrobacter TaxID=196806 RepID=UPI001787C44B|nr:3'-5' exonuclease [Psychrobacter sp. FME5]MBE0444592.1 3'-5' exonuclease [Psychrobacter sp. FME5]MDN5891865.1 3'-5' exonuclease [Psychrobacter sp.]
MNWLKQLSSSLQKRQLQRPELAAMFSKPLAKQWVAIDCEMTGLNPKKHHLLSVAAIHINDNTIDTGNGMHLVCKPPVMPDRDTIVIHGLRTADVEHGMSYDDMLALLLPFIGNRPIVGFCTQIDTAFLNPLVKRYMGTALPNEIIDLRHLYSRRMSGQTQGLSSQAQHLTNILAHYNIPELGAHDAYNDALMTAMAFLHVR